MAHTYKEKEHDASYALLGYGWIHIMDGCVVIILNIDIDTT